MQEQQKNTNMFGIGFQEIIIIALVVLLFFGGKKIPELMKGLGKGVRSFKDGMNGKEDNEYSSENWTNIIKHLMDSRDVAASLL